MEGFGLFQEPFEPAAVESELFEFGERAGGVYEPVVGKLGTLNEIKNDGVFEADEDRSDTL